jgi:hypothetical protein
VIAVSAALAACSRHPSPVAPTMNDQTYTEDDVRNFVLPGTSREAIIKRFGEPQHQDKNPIFEDGSTAIDEIIYFDLPFPNPPREERWAFAGFQVRLKNGKAVDWMATHQDIYLGR